MGPGNLSDLFQQFRPRYRWGFLLVWNGLAIGGIVWSDFRNPAQTPPSLTLIAAAGFILFVVSCGLLTSTKFRDEVLYPGYSLDGYRLLLGVAGLAGFLITVGATAMLMAG
jgi:hypothetical protein